MRSGDIRSIVNLVTTRMPQRLGVLLDLGVVHDTIVIVTTAESPGAAVGTARQ
ncbi:hypothetical protein BH23GEM9_BH23GEM9_24680 [soil metagenome]